MTDRPPRAAKTAAPRTGRPARRNANTEPPPLAPPDEDPDATLARWFGEPRFIGRPRTIESPEAFDRMAEAYFRACAQVGEPLTLTGLCLAIGLASRESLDRYQRRPEFRDSVKRARMVIEKAYELRMHGAQPVGAIFALKNFGWTDRQQIEFRGVLARLDYSRLGDDVVQRIAAGEPLEAVLSDVPVIRGLLGPGAPADGGSDSPTTDGLAGDDGG